jgi:hypothetical protein
MLLKVFLCVSLSVIFNNILLKLLIINTMALKNCLPKIKLFFAPEHYPAVSDLQNQLRF